MTIARMITIYRYHLEPGSSLFVLSRLLFIMSFESIFFEFSCEMTSNIYKTNKSASFVVLVCGRISKKPWLTYRRRVVLRFEIEEMECIINVWAIRF